MSEKPTLHPNNPLVEHVRRELVKALVTRHMFCPVNGTVLDVRTCVVFVDRDGDPSGVLSQSGYQSLLAEHPDRITALAEAGHTVDESTVKAVKG